jgi:MoaA/NifB/PqqE/SkfB family radical SAM enzyme
MAALLMATKSKLPIPSLPAMICFRVTRFCNAKCGFCLAPPDGGVHPAVEDLKYRIHWLRTNGVKTIHFCGGEPTIHKDLHELLYYVHTLGGKSKMTTNGMLLSDALLTALQQCHTEVKVSLHGNAQQHNRILGRDAFDKNIDTIKKLVKAKVYVSIQTTIVTGHLDVVEWVINFCIQNGIKKVSFLPFIPRGVGNANRTVFALTSKERRDLGIAITDKRKTYNNRLDVRLLDFNARPIHVVEPDGAIILEGAMEAMDKVLYRIGQQTVGNEP